MQLILYYAHHLTLVSARKTSSAPIYFSRFKMDNEIYIDGGVKEFNNPINIALLEGQRLLSGRNPDLVVSLGTGFILSVKSHGIRTSVLRWLVSAFLSISDGEKIWESFIDGISLEERHKFERLNIELGKEKEVALDDIRSISELRETVQTFFLANQNLFERVARKIILTQFYFLLSRIKSKGRRIEAIGEIRCRLTDERERNKLMCYIEDRHWRFFFDTKMIHENFRTNERDCPLQIHVSFDNEDKKHIISLGSSPNDSFFISGFPCALREIPFKRTKRKRSLSLHGRPLKKRRFI